MDTWSPALRPHSPLSLLGGDSFFDDPPTTQHQQQQQQQQHQQQQRARDSSAANGFGYGSGLGNGVGSGSSGSGSGGGDDLHDRSHMDFSAPLSGLPSLYDHAGLDGANGLHHTAHSPLGQMARARDVWSSDESSTTVSAASAWAAGPDDAIFGGLAGSGLSSLFTPQRSRTQSPQAMVQEAKEHLQRSLELLGKVKGDAAAGQLGAMLGTVDLERMPVAALLRMLEA
jgi:hypothetical protein